VGRASPGGQWDLVEAFDRGSLAGPARALWALETCYERFRRWQADGTWRRLLAHAQTKSDAVGEVDWEVVVDATIVRAHQHAAGAVNGHQDFPVGGQGISWLMAIRDPGGWPSGLR
jgi:transposase